MVYRWDPLLRRSKTNDAPHDRSETRGEEQLDRPQKEKQSLSRVTRYYVFTHRNGPPPSVASFCPPSSRSRARQ